MARLFTGLAVAVPSPAGPALEGGSSSGEEAEGLLVEHRSLGPPAAARGGPRRATWRAAVACAAAALLVAAVGLARRWGPAPGAAAGMRQADGARSASVGFFSFGSLDPLTRCSKSDCSSCLQESGCRWCAQTQDCHDETSIMDKCNAPIDSKGQCWGQYCPYQLGEFLNHRADDAKEWMEQTMMHQADELLPFPTYPPGVTGIFDLATGLPLTDASAGSPVSNYVVAAIADWGSGTCAAKVVGEIAAADNPQMTIHMGDVYYVATPEQYGTNLLGQARTPHQPGILFPKGQIITFLQMGNHELISGCKGLYVNGFAYTGQQATYAAWQTDSWRIISLDTGRLCYSTDEMGVRNVETGTTDAPLPDEVVDWLTNTVNLGDPNDKRGVILLSHHQPYDAFSSSYMGAANQLNKILPQGKQLLWIFGHDHMLAFYKKMQLEGTDFVIYPRLIGIGGFPNILAKPKKTDGLVAYDFRTYQSLPDDDGISQNVGFNGYAKLVITDNKLDISYITASCKDGDCSQGLSESDSTTVAFETFTADTSTGQVEQTWMYVSPELTKVSEPQDEVASISCIPQSALADYNTTLNHYD